MSRIGRRAGAGGLACAKAIAWPAISLFSTTIASSKRPFLTFRKKVFELLLVPEKSHLLKPPKKEPETCCSGFFHCWLHLSTTPSEKFNFYLGQNFWTEKWLKLAVEHFLQFWTCCDQHHYDDRVFQCFPTHSENVIWIIVSVLNLGQLLKITNIISFKYFQRTEALVGWLAADIPTLSKNTPAGMSDWMFYRNVEKLIAPGIGRIPIPMQSRIRDLLAIMTIDIS